MALSDEVNDVKLLALASERMVKADPAMFVPAEHLYAELGITQDDLDAVDEVDIYSSRNALEQSAEIDEDTGNLKELSVAAKKAAIESGGTYKIAPDVDAKIEFASYAVMHFSQGEPPIDAKSVMVTSFSRPIGIDALIPAVIYAKCFLKYITYRTNVKIGNVEIFSVNSAKKREQCGYLVFEEDYQAEISTMQ